MIDTFTRFIRFLFYWLFEFDMPAFFHCYHDVYPLLYLIEGQESWDVIIVLEYPVTYSWLRWC